MKRQRKLFNLTSEHLTLLIIIAVAALIRLWRINWGLPDLYEEATPLTISWKFWNWGKPGLDFNPRFFNYPALTFYIQFIAQGINFVFGDLFGVYNSLSDFGSTVTPLVVTSRLVDVLFDIGIIIVVYKIGKEIWNTHIATFASLYSAINPFQVSYSHLIQVDTILTFFSALAILFIYRIYSDQKTKWYIFAGISIALAAASKYTGAFLILFLIVTHFLQPSAWKQPVKKHIPLLVSIGLAVFIFFALNPYILITPGEFQKDFSFEQQHVATGHLGVLESQSSFAYYLLDVIPSSFGWIFFISLIATSVYIIIRKDKKELLLLVYPVIFLAVVSTWEMRAERYILPLFPIISLIGSIGLVRFWGWLKSFIEKKQIRFITKQFEYSVLVCFFLILFVPLMLSNYKYLHNLGLRDTRAVTKEWIKKNIPAGSIIATGPYGIEFPDSSYTMFSIPFLAFETQRVAPFYDSRWYEDFDLVIASSYDYDRYKKEPDKYRDFLPYYDSLKTNWKLLFETKSSETQTGPTYWLYKYPDSLRQPTFDKELFERFNASPESSRISNFLKAVDMVLYHKGRFAKCEQILKEILSVEYQNVPLRNQLGEIMFKLGEYEPALGQLGISIQLNPNQPAIYALGGNILLKLKKYQNAEAAFLKALSMLPDMEQAHLGLIDLYKEENDKVKLLNALKQYYNLLPPNSSRAKEIEFQIQKLQK